MRNTIPEDAFQGEKIPDGGISTDDSSVAWHKNTPDTSVSKFHRPAGGLDNITEPDTSGAVHVIPAQDTDRVESPRVDFDVVPDGGLMAWLQVLGSWVIAVDTWGIINSYGVFQTYYERELLISRSASDLSWIGSMQGALLMMVGVIAGPAYDSGYFRHILWTGLVLIIFGQFMASISETYWQMVLSQGVCMGVGCGLVFLPSTAILSQYFKKRRTFALGIASTGSPVASMVFPIIFGRLTPKIGFPWATRVIAFVMLALAVIPLLFMRLRVPPPGRVRSLVDRTAVRDLPLMLCCAGTFFSFLTIYVGFFYIQSFAIDFNITSVDFSPYLVTLLGAGSIFGRLGPNYLADKTGPLNMLIAASISCGILCFGWMGIRNLGGLIVFALLYGAGSGALVSISPSAVVSLTEDLSVVGTRMGMMFFSTGVAVLVGAPIAGLVIGGADEEGGASGEGRWLGAIGYSGAGLMFGGLVLGASKWSQFRKTRSWRG